MPTTQDILNDDTAPQLSEAGMHVFMGSVDPESIKPIIEWILIENHVVKKKKRELLLMICSEGGHLEAAFALVDVMAASKIPIKTVGLGQIASAGLVIFMAGHAGRRVLTPNTSILSHQYSWGSEGKHHDLFAVTKEFGLAHDRMVRHYQQATGLDADTVRARLLPPTDTWLSAAEALELGLCDHVSDLKK
jgi:ATP-dependent Clp protease protease subunit